MIIIRNETVGLDLIIGTAGLVQHNCQQIKKVKLLFWFKEVIDVIMSYL